MSAIKNERILIDVTRGDCVDANRKSGKSNTGTYFVSSVKNFDEFLSYFDDKNVYKFDLIKLNLYVELFKKFFLDLKDEYIGKMSEFDSFSSYLLSLPENPNVGIVLRKNDSRIFMRFEDNTLPVINAFRNMLYENLSYIAIEKKNIFYYVYPVINEEYIKIKKESNNGLVLDE